MNTQPSAPDHIGPHRARTGPEMTISLQRQIKRRKTS